MLGCLFCEALLTHDPTYLDLAHCNEAPSREFLFGTDPMGRDIFSMIWYGGRISLTIGVLSTLLSTAIAILFGTVSGCAPDWLDRLLMRLTEILLSVPNLLLVVLLQAILARQMCSRLARHRADELGQHRQGRSHGGAQAAQQRICAGLALHGRRLLPRPAAAPCAEFLLVHLVHGRYEHPQRHHGGIDA